MTFRTPGLQPRERRPRHKGIYIGAPKCFALQLACQQLAQAFDPDGGFGGCYVVGSALERPNWRDVDLVFILDDASFAKLFPDVQGEAFEFDQRWLIMTVAISAWLSSVSGLPIDFKFQPQTHANARHSGWRSAIGLRFARKKKDEAD